MPSKIKRLRSSRFQRLTLEAGVALKIDYALLVINRLHLIGPFYIMPKKPSGSTEKKAGDKKGKVKNDGEEKVSYSKSLSLVYVLKGFE